MGTVSQAIDTNTAVISAARSPRVAIAKTGIRSSRTPDSDSNCDSLVNSNTVDQNPIKIVAGHRVDFWLPAHTRHQQQTAVARISSNAE